MPDLIITTPAGLTLSFDPVPSPFHGGSGSPVVTSSPDVPGLQFFASGIYPLGPEFTYGVRGTLEILITIPTAGTARALIFLANSRVAPTAYVGIALDASNRPYTIIKDSLGVTVGQTASTSTALVAGTTLLVRLMFDSTKAIQGTRLAYLEAPKILKSWTTDPQTPWAPMVPTHLIVGIGGFAGLSDFTGTIKTAFASPFVGAVPVDDVGETLPDTAHIVGNSSVVAHLGYKLPITSSVAGDSSIAASAKVKYALDSTMTGDSAMTATPLFTPADLGAAVLAWLRGDLVTLDGSNNVQTMTDKGPSGYNGTQVSAPNRPGWAANGGLGYLVLTGTESLQVLGSPAQAQPFEVFIVARSTGTPAGNVFLLDSGFGSSTFITQQNTTGFIVMNAGTALDDADLGTADHIIDAQFDGVTSNLSLDGNAGTTGNAGANQLGASLTIGNAVASFVDGFSGRLYEILIVIGLLSAPNRAKVVTYFKDRYTIP